VPASIQDRETPAEIEPELAASTLPKIWADLAFNGEAATAPMTRCGIDLELVGRKGKTGFEVEPKRWRVEQTLGVLGRYRRLLVDHEGSTVMSRTMLLLAALFMTANRFERRSWSEFSARLLAWLCTFCNGCRRQAPIQKKLSVATKSRAALCGMMTGPKSPGVPQASRRHHKTRTSSLLPVGRRRATWPPVRRL
jgi:transposase